MGTPIKLNGSSGDIKEFTTSEENYLAYQLGLRLAAAAKNTPGSLDNIARGGQTTVGTYTDTSFDQAVGTHPQSGITTTTVNVLLYQNTGSGTETGSGFKRPIHWNTALTPDSIQEMTDTNFNSCIDRLLSTVFTNDYPGTFKLASSAPSADYTSEISNIFSDTRTDGSVVNYSIFKRRTMTAPTAVRSIAIKRDAASSKPDNFAGLQEMTDAEIRETFGERAKTRISASLIGTYQLRSSADGAPTDAGTWVSKGTATDTRQEKGDVDYTRNSTAISTTAYSGNYTGNFIGDYLGEYASNSTNTFTGDFAGNYVGDSPSVAGSYTFDSLSYNQEGPVYYTGNYGATSVDYTRGSTRNSTNTFTGDFIGDYVGDYIGEVASISGSYTSDSLSYITEGPVYYTGNYGSSPTDYIGGDYVGDYIGAADYIRNSTRTSSETYVARIEYFTGDYIGNYIADANFAGNYIANYSSILEYIGDANFGGNYNSASTSDFIGDFTGNYTGNYSGITTYIGIADYIGNSTSDFIGDFTGNYSSTSTRDSTNDFIGDYGQDYIGDFIGNYAGSTILATNETIETYTLYVRVA